MKIIQSIRHFLYGKIYDTYMKGKEQRQKPSIPIMTEKDIEQMGELLAREPSDCEYAYIDGEELVVKRLADPKEIRIPLWETNIENG